MTRPSRTVARHAALGLALTGALLLTACSGQAPAADGGFDPDEEIELHIAWWGNDERAAIMADAIDLFEAEYPNITVVEEPVGAPDDLFNRLATDFASNTAPDVFALGGAKPQEYGAAGALLDLSTVADQLDTSKYPDFTLTNATVDDTLYGLPTGGNAIGALINVDLFTQAGVPVPSDDWTWEDLADAANQISAELPGVVGLDLRIQDILGTYIAQYSEDGIYDWDGELATDAETVQQWYEYEQSLVESGGLPDPSTIVEHWNVTPDLTLFGTGKAAISFAYNNQIGSYAAGTGGADVQIIAPPSSTGVSGVSVLPSQFWSIASGSKHPEAAALLVDWLLNQPEPAKLILANRGLPFNPDTLAVVKPLLAPADAQSAEYLEKVLEVGVVAPPQPAGGSILNELSQRIESDILFGKTSAADGAKQWIDELGTSLAND
ncbi:ABC transporter substrate-binding protein [Agromyces larvae]|uniref:Sugar ABC transporter substrate-binding protein n=1 Tax=Agromyces larvae TaxID=2929802 RepID=A0ABY4C118_9MICO|nr:sugar ABC transporter substrate-binding protein [Agromyces larvae]UOE43663.1 sugar ABC transporter substrate-binding protein [Agromyces larvae]